MIVRVTIAILLCLGLAGQASLSHADDASQADQSVTLLAGRVLMPNGTLRDNAVVVVREGKIEKIGERSDFKNQALHALGPQTVISPGMIDLFALPGIIGQTVEDTEAIEPDTSAAQLLDPSHHDLRTALEAGITAVLVAPTATNLVNGICVTARTHAAGQIDWLRDDGPLLLAFGDGVWRSDRKPTSRAVAITELRKLIEQGRQGASHPRINAAVAGKLDAWVACSNKQDVRAVCEALGDAKGHFGLIHTKDALEVVEWARGTRQPVVLGPYSMTTSRRELLGAAALGNADIEIAFRAGFPSASAQALRLSAALAVRHGLDAAAARRALTCSPARVAGVAKRVGSISPGLEADLVIFSQDPLRMDAQVLEVYVRGQRVFSAQHQKSTKEGATP